MLRRLLLGYLGLTLVVLVSFGVPFGILWANHARADEVTALEQSTSEAAAAVTGPLRRAYAADRVGSKVQIRDRDEDGDGIVSNLPLTSGGRAAIAAGLGDFSTGTRTLVALLGSDATVLAALGTDRAAAGRSFGRATVAATTTGQVAAGQTTVGGTSLLYAAVTVRAPLNEPVEPGSRIRIHDGLGIPLGVVVLAEPTEVVTNRIRTIAASLAALGAGILVLATVAAWALVRSLVRPLKQIELAVADLGSGDLLARAPTGHGPSELVELAETVNVMAVQLSELISVQRAFVADASHQLRTPLTALRLRLEGLPAEGAPPSGEVGAILSEVERLSRLVTGLLGLAQAEEAPNPPELVDVAGILAGRGEAWQSVAEEQDVALETTLARPTRALVVTSDLEQALDNLLDNALRAAPAGSTVRLEVGEEDGWVTLHVVDEGAGMPPEDRLHAFDRFWTRRAERGRGSGLGLAIVSRLVHHSGGEVELRDGPGSTGIDATIRLRRT